MADDNKPFAFSQFVPGFDFLRSLTGGGAGGAVPGLAGLSNWVAPTLSVEEIDKRIGELKTVQYWLEQNIHALKATVQALEVQKMTLSTLQGMNVQMEDLANAFTRGTTSAAEAMRTAAGAAAGSPSSDAEAAQESAAQAQDEPDAAEATETASESAAETAAQAGSASARRATKKTESAAGQGVVDTLQWWNALTQQFQQIASNALQDAAHLKMPAQPDAAAPAAPPAKRGASPRSGKSAASATAAKPASAAKSAKATRAPSAAPKRGTAARKASAAARQAPPVRKR